MTTQIIQIKKIVIHPYAINNNNNNNNNNYKTSIAPISSKRIEFSGVHSTGVRQTHSPCTMQSSSTMIRWKLRKDKRVGKGEIANSDRKKLCYLVT